MDMRTRDTVATYFIVNGKAMYVTADVAYSERGRTSETDVWNIIATDVKEGFVYELTQAEEDELVEKIVATM